MANNDERILALKAQIEVKKTELAKTKARFAPITNCILDFEGQKLNIQTLGAEQLALLLVKLNALKLSAEDLGILNQITMSGYGLEEWIKDTQARVSIMGAKAKETELKRMQDKLEALLSEDKKTELELEAIAKQLEAK